MRASYHNLLHLVAVGTIVALSVLLFNSKQAPEKVAITMAEVKLPTEAMTKEWLARADESQAKAKEQWLHLAKLKEQSGFLAGDQIKDKSKSLAEVTSEVEKATERLKQTKKALNTYKQPFSTSVEFNVLERSQRIPPGATDPDKLWRSQMENVRATLRGSAIPMH